MRLLGRILMTLLTIIVVLIVAAWLWVRLAPTDTARWHVAPTVTEDKTMTGGALRRVAGGADKLQALHDRAMATPRTQVLAGGPDSGMTTYVTRSRAWGFPDYTTVATDGDDMILHARLRFGRSDFGVNAARVDGWIAQLP